MVARPRVLVIHSFYRASLPSGENDAVRAQVELLNSNGYATEVFGPSSPDNASLHQQVAMGFRTAAGLGLDPVAAIKSFRPDVIHVHNLFPNISTRWIADCRVPIVLSLHNYRPLCANGVLSRNGRACTKCLVGSRLNAVRHNCYRESRLASAAVLGFQIHLRQALENDIDMVVFPSPVSEALTAKHLRLKSSVILPNFVKDVGPLGPRSVEVEPPFFLVLGRLTREKGIDKLISKWPSEIQLVIAGDGPERPNLEQMARGLPIQFVGYVQPGRRDPLLRAAAGLILPSVTLEADPLVVAQALSAGTPCIVESGTATARFSAISASVLTYNDAGSLYSQLLYTLNNDLSDSARILYEQTWSANAWLRGYQFHVLRELVQD